MSVWNEKTLKATVGVGNKSELVSLNIEQKISMAFRGKSSPRFCPRRPAIPIRRSLAA
jgi:hypothetical protein